MPADEWTAFICRKCGFFFSKGMPQIGCDLRHEDVHGMPVERIRVTPVERARRAEEALRELAEGKHEASPATRAFARSFSRSEPSEPRA